MSTLHTNVASKCGYVFISSNKMIELANKIDTETKPFAPRKDIMHLFIILPCFSLFHSFKQNKAQAWWILRTRERERERKGERDKHRDKQTDRQTDRGRDRDRQTDTERQRQRQTGRQRQAETGTGQTDRQTDRGAETGTDRQRDRGGGVKRSGDTRLKSKTTMYIDEQTRRPR